MKVWKFIFRKPKKLNFFTYKGTCIFITYIDPTRLWFSFVAIYIYIHISTRTHPHIYTYNMNYIILPVWSSLWWCSIWLVSQIHGLPWHVLFHHSIGHPFRSIRPRHHFVSQFYNNNGCWICVGLRHTVLAILNHSVYYRLVLVWCCFPNFYPLEWICWTSPPTTLYERFMVCFQFRLVNNGLDSLLCERMEDVDDLLYSSVDCWCSILEVILFY